MLELIERIKVCLPGASIEVEYFSSNSYCITICYRHRVFVLDYSSTLNQYGVDELGVREEGFNDGYQCVVSSVEDAEESLYKIIKLC